MEASEVQDVCRLCPETGATQPLLNVFDRKFAEKNNMKEVILITTGIEISESDIISKKICRKCYKNTRIITQIRQTAMLQDENLKQKCQQYLSDKGLRLANTRIIIKKTQPQEVHRPQPTSSELFDMLLKSSNINKKVAYRKKICKTNKTVHPSIIDIYKNNPKFKLPRKCLHRDVAPTVSLAMEEVETYFKKRKLDMFKYIYKPGPSVPKVRQVARKRTAVRFKAPKEVTHPSPVNELKESILKDWDDVEDDLLKVSHVVPLGPETIRNDNSVDSSSTSTSKPAFIESLGLTPAMSVARFPSILICKICSSVQNNVAALKKHHSRHRVCEYCKVKLKSVEKKNNHVKQCDVKKILESPESFVCLEKVESNLNLRKRYRECFTKFSPIPGLDEGPSSKVIVIVDEEETATGYKDDVIEVESNSAVTLVAPTSSSVVRPVIGICNDTVLEQLKLTDASTDQIVVRNIANVVSKLCKLDAGVQTEVRNHPPLIKDGNCTLKNFKRNLLSYAVPVKISKGNFNVSYISTEIHQNNDKSGMWSNLPVMEKRIRTPPKTELSLMNTTYPVTFVQSSQLAVSSIQLMTTTPTMSIFLPNTSAILQGAGLALQPSQTINNAIFNPLGNASIQTTPLLQNYTLSMGPLPVINNPASTSSEKSPNVADSNAGGSGEGKSEASGSSRRVSRKEVGRKNRSKRPFIKVKIGKMPKSARRSKLRVKNIWELK